MPKGKGKSKTRRFEIREDSTKKELRSVLKKMEVERYDIHEYTGEGSRIAFVRGGREYQFICDEFNNYPDNMRAAERGIHLLWLVFEDYMVRTADVAVDFGTIFMGFAVTDGQKVLAITDGARPCWEILGLEKGATKDEVRARYKVLSKKHHPDKGGGPDEMAMINSAYEEFINLKS